MRTLTLTSAVALLLAATPALATDPIEGVWQTQPDDGAYAHVTIAPCGQAFCGVISRTFNAGGEYPSENLGKYIVRNMAPDGPGKYKGQVWRPSNDKVYVGKITLGDAEKIMDLRGCVAGGLICAKQRWTKLD